MIAHIVGSTVLGYFILDEALYVLLNIGFIWTVFLDGEMGLLPHPVAIGELEIESNDREAIAIDVDRLLSGDDNALARMTRAPVECVINDVGFFEEGERRLLLLTGEQANLSIETSMTEGSIQINES